MFMLFVTLALFLLDFVSHVAEPILRAVEIIDAGILAGYYVFFFDGLFNSAKKVDYVKSHWVMLILLILPFLPLARLLELTMAQRALDVSSKTLWHFLDELKML